jgi:hypothetical protein
LARAPAALDEKTVLKSNFGNGRQEKMTSVFRQGNFAWLLMERMKMK